jgi:hypothetical protein
MDVRFAIEQLPHSRRVTNRNGIPDNQHSGKRRIVDRVGKGILKGVLLLGVSLSECGLSRQREQAGDSEGEYCFVFGIDVLSLLIGVTFGE